MTVDLISCSFVLHNKFALHSYETLSHYCQTPDLDKNGSLEKSPLLTGNAAKSCSSWNPQMGRWLSLEIRPLQLTCNNYKERLCILRGWSPDTWVHIHMLCAWQCIVYSRWTVNSIYCKLKCMVAGMYSIATMPVAAIFHCTYDQLQMCGLCIN